MTFFEKLWVFTKRNGNIGFDNGKKEYNLWVPIAHIGIVIQYVVMTQPRGFVKNGIC